MDFQDDIQLLQDSIGGQRSKLDVIASILHICRDGSLKNHIVGKGNFSDAMANHYISILLYRGFLQTGKDKNSRSVYTTTDKGRQLLRHYGEIQKLFAGEPVVAIEASHASAAQPRKSAKILVVDDEPDIISAMKIGLQDYEFHVDVSNDPIQVLKSYIPGSYELLILDIKCQR